MTRIPQCAPSFGPEETEAVARYMSSGKPWMTEHDKTREFEHAIATYTGAKHCIVTTSGTMALMLAGMALGIGHGDGVIVPDYTMIATANAFRALEARPVFVDVEEETLCLSWERLVDRLHANNSRLPQVVVAMNANGRVTEFRHTHVTWSDINMIPIIEDACQALGSFYPDGTHCGRKGLVGALSFSPHKIVSTGQGGALITDDDEMAKRLRRLKDFGRDSGGGDVHPHFGINGKFTDVQAVIGLEQMKKLPARVERKRAMHNRYMRNLPAHVEQICGIPNGYTPWFYEILVPNRSELCAYLIRNRGPEIGTRPMYPPIHKQPCYATEDQLSWRGEYPVAERVGREGLWLPSSVDITDAEIDEVCDAIRRFYS